MFVTGTDTGVGKTEICCALIRAARRRHLRAMPFKPAQSGTDKPTDAERLADAGQLIDLTPSDIAPLRYARPLAPGMAQDMDAFLEPRTPADLSHLRAAERHLKALEEQHKPDLVLIEGAGGLFVPMPGGTWQPQWIERLGGSVVLVTRPTLGTINHSWLTLHALKHLRLPVTGIIINESDQGATPPDESLALNRRLLSKHPDAPLLGSFPHREERTPGDIEDLLFDALWSRL